MHQKLRLRMIGHYSRSCHVIMHNTCEMWGLIYLCAMRTVPMSCHMLPHVQLHHARIAGGMHTGKLATPMYMWCARNYLWTCHSCQLNYLSKLTTSHFGTQNMRIANQNVLKRILIAMHNENKADCNENFRICEEEHMGPLHKW